MTDERRSKVHQYWKKEGICGLVSRTILRTLQFVFAITVAGIYGVDLSQATASRRHAASSWVFAEVIACLSALTCIVHCFLTVKRVGWCVWDWVLFVLWLAQTGVFGKMYYGGDASDPEFEDATTSKQRMKAGVWIDLINMVLWLTTAIFGIGWCIRARRVTRRTDKLDTEQTVGIGRSTVDVRKSLDSSPPEYDSDSNGAGKGYTGEHGLKKEVSKHSNRHSV